MGPLSDLAFGSNFQNKICVHQMLGYETVRTWKTLQLLESHQLTGTSSHDDGNVFVLQHGRLGK